MYSNFDSIIALIKEEYKGRKLLIWGAWEIGRELAEALRENNLELYAYIDSNHYGEDYNGYSVISPDVLDEDNRSEYYLIVSLVEHASVYKALEDKTWKEFEDFIYLGKTVTLTSCNNYKDVYGNQIESKVSGNLEIKMACGSKLIIEEGVQIGKNVLIEATMLSEVYIKKGVSIMDNVHIRANCKGKIIIGSHCYLGSNIFMRCIDDGVVIIDNHCRFRGDMEISAGDDGEMQVGSHSTFGINNIIRIFKSKFECGSDCMFAYNLRIRGRDGHPIIDIKNHKILEGKKDVKLGNHVWVGMGATIMPGTEIGDNSIVGANSMVNHSFPPNVLLIGTPARIHRTDVTWNRSSNITYEEWEKAQNNHESPFIE